MRQRIVAGIILSLVAATSNAALLGRAPATTGGTDYQAYYDTVLNITWLADANLATTNSFGVTGICTDSSTPGCPEPGGAMDWYVAHDWIAAMNSANYLGVNNWRLPSMDVNGNNVIRDCRVVSETFCRDNELGYMYWRNNVQGGSLSAPFTNIANYAGIGYYGSGTEYAADPSRRWFFNFGILLFGETLNPKTATMHEWPVSPGDFLPVPVPAAAWLLGSALGVLGWMRRRATRS